ncbi:MAG: DUF885 family protein [Gemmatimonadota bacterium]|nr:DUF885 family protein [Gemmatimonadota bacterium]
MSTISHKALEEKAEAYLAFMAEHFPVMSASDEFIFFPRAEGSFKYCGEMEDLSGELVAEGIELSGKTLSYLDSLDFDKENDLDIEIDAWLLRIHARNYLRVFETEGIHLYDPSIYFKVATHGLVMAADQPVSLAGRLERAVKLFQCGGKQLVSTTALKLEQSLVWSSNFMAFLGELSAELGIEESSELHALLDAVSSFRSRLEHLRISSFVPESLGPQRYSALIEEAFGLRESPEELYDVLVRERQRLTLNLQAAAVRTGHHAYEWQVLASDPPAAGWKHREPVEWYRDELGRLVSWLAEHQETTDIDTSLIPEIKPMPGYMRGLRTSASYASSAGTDRRGVFYIGSDGPAKEPDSRLAAHADYRYITAHETFPGHHHLDTVRRNLDSPIRRQSENALFYEGWACWAEQRMVDLGYFFRPNEQMCIERRKLQRCVRSACELGIHLGTLNDMEAASMLEEIGIRIDPAEQLVRQYRCQPGYQLTYTIGRLKIERLVEKYKSAAGTEDELYRRLLSAGEITFDLLERHLERCFGPGEHGA